MRRLAPLVAAFLLIGCAAGLPGPIRPPAWLPSAGQLNSILRISQSATFAGPRRLRVCRRIENASPQPVLIRNVESEGDNYGELSVAYYDRRGEWMPPPRPRGFLHHPMMVPPPPPASDDDVSIYTVMAPGRSVANCKEHDIEPGLDVFQVVTYYRPTLSAELVPARARTANLLLTHQFGYFASQPCLVNAGQQRIDCSIAAPGANEVPSSESLASAFTPNARVCVRFDLQGHIVAAAVDGRLNDRAVNRQMLDLLRSRRWDPPPPAAAGGWIALAVAPDGSPVPEVVPDCHRLPR